VVILVVFDALIYGSGGGPDGIQLEALNVFQLTSPGVGLAAGVGLFLAFWSWVGFEAIPNYAEESKDPGRIIPRATLLSVIGLGIGYVITSLAFVSAFSERTLIKDAQNPEGPFFVAMENFGTNWLATIMQVFILTGSFACAMAFHNVAMRYLYAMGREGVVPKALGRTHPTHRSPYIASLVQTAFAIVLVLIWGIGAGGFGFGAAFDTAYVRIYTMMAVQGVVWILAIQAVCALAVIVWHRRHKHPDSMIAVVVCPIIAIVGQVFAIYLLFANIDTLAGTIGYVDLIAPIAVLGVVGALVYAMVLKRRNRAKFDLIGRMIDEGV
jgi:amino acid transporter